MRTISESRPPGNLRATPEPAPVETIARWLRLFFAPGDVTELRALGHTARADGKFPETVAGYFDFDHLDLMAREARRLTPHARGVYFLLNPLDPDLLARCCNKVATAGKDFSAGDADVLRRRWLPVDVDSRRKSGISATEAERRRAKRVAWEVHKFLTGRGWPAPVIGDSGNGYHLIYRIDEPRDDGGRVKHCLEALASRFDDESVSIDTSVHNPARIWRLFGSLNRKGDHAGERPHRATAVLSVPSEKGGAGHD
jgi:hypothetical protein